MIRGMHAMFYSSQASELRAFLRDKLSLSGRDVGGGWLIFDAQEADLGVHPTENGDPPSGTAGISFYCDDIHETIDELKQRGVEFTEEVSDQGQPSCEHVHQRGEQDETGQQHLLLDLHAEVAARQPFERENHDVPAVEHRLVLAS